MKENKYEIAFEYLIRYWDSHSKEQQKIINKRLNEIFGKDHQEYLEEEDQ